MSADTQVSYADGMWKALSQERLEGGYGGSGVSRVELLSRYVWNVALCEALYPSLQALEVALRNTLFNAGAAVYPIAAPAKGQVPCWLDAPGLLQPDEAASVAAAKARLRSVGKPLEPGRLVAELTFGFWTALFDVRYENTRILWPRLFSQKIFADAPKKLKNRKSLSPLLNRVRHLRNRAFHHEPIWHWSDLSDQHAVTLDLIGWMSPPLRQTVEALDRFRAVHSAGPHPLLDVIQGLATPSTTASEAQAGDSTTVGPS